MIKPSVKTTLLLVLMLSVPSEVFSKKRISVRSYAPVLIHSSGIAEGPGPYRKCLIDADFRNENSFGIWIIFVSPADMMKKGKLLHRGDGPVRFSFTANGSLYRSVTVSDQEGKGFTGIYLEPGAKVRIKEFEFTLMNYPGSVRILTAKELKVNRKISLKKWMAGLERGEKISVESISLTTTGLEIVEAAAVKSWVYLLEENN